MIDNNNSELMLHISRNVISPFRWSKTSLNKNDMVWASKKTVETVMRRRKLRNMEIALIIIRKRGNSKPRNPFLKTRHRRNYTPSLGAETIWAVFAEDFQFTIWIVLVTFDSTWLNWKFIVTQIFQVSMHLHGS